MEMENLNIIIQMKLLKVENFIIAVADNDGKSLRETVTYV